MTPLEIGIIIAAFSVVLASLLAYTVRQGSRLQDLEVKYATLATQVSPLWAQIQSRIASDLHHPHPRYMEMDGLLEKLEALTITPEERIRLDELLKARSVDESPDISEIQRKEATLMSHVMDIVVLEAKSGLSVVLAWIGLHTHFWR